jgi:hypothetical protein
MRAPLLRILPLGFSAVFGALLATGCGDGDDTKPSHAAGGAGGTAGNNEAGEPTGPGPGTSGGDAGAPGDAGGAAGGTSVCGEVSVDAMGAGSWDSRFTIAGVTGHDGITPTVYDFALEPDGSVLATGRFAYHEGKPVPPLLRLRDGKWQPAHETWTLEPPGDGFDALSLNEAGALALATSDSFGERDGEIWLDRDDEQQVIGSFAGQVRTLAWFGDQLYVAGSFQLDSELGGFANLAVWDGEHWAAPAGGEPDGPVLELRVSGGSLYVGGAFTSVGGVDSANVASFDGAAWTALPLEQALAVYALARTDEGELYAGGALGEISAPGGVVKRVGDAWQVVGGGLAQLQTRGVVSDLVAHDGVVDATGCFSAAGGLADDSGAVQAFGLARWTGSEWQSLNDGSGTNSPWFQPGVCGDEAVGALWDMEYQRLTVAGGELFVGGSFAGVGGVQTQSLAVRRDDEWLAQGKSGLGLGGSLDRVVAGGPDCDLYGLGSFTHLGGEPAPGRVARFADGAWQALKDDLPGDAYCPAIDIAQDGTLAVACMVFPAVGAAHGVVLTPRGQQQLVELELDVPLPPIHALKWDGSGKLWLAGGETGGFVATVESGHVTVVNQDFDGLVQHLDVRDGDDVLVAGMFSKVGDVDAQRIAHYVDGEWSALGKGLIGQPQAIGRDAERVYASTYNEGQGAYLLGAFDGKAWSELAGGKSGLAVQDYYSFNQILPVTGGVLLVGTAELQGGAGRGALLLKDGKLQPVGGGGIHAIGLSGIAVARDALWFGGIIAEAAGRTDLVSSVGIARLAW